MTAEKDVTPLSARATQDDADGAAPAAEPLQASSIIVSDRPVFLSYRSIGASPGMND